ncbi:hypothetical protein Malapachy_1945 [Malassezia pachydermatis]|uniref:Queuosine 5'-phosphate N-glycosylase/hydrolase n=1 Tax=Malassezia pachydermatis TaxID=77020 RepID=A0A0M9VNX3_9BASI|nr:hypothetical protein Malapachy_1945 [Malassezia pachydermatis]KOS13809.1 hypothetical protein Malapachy_1945 [Malassezia pachydermatis]
MAAARSVPTPVPGTALSMMRAQAADVAQGAGIDISDAHIDQFLRSLSQDRFEKHKAQHGLRFPLRFGSWAEECNFLCVLSLLNAFSGYRVDFHKVTGHGSYDNVRRCVMGLYLSSDDGTSLQADALARVSTTELAQILGVPTHTEEAHPSLPFVTVGTVGGPLEEPLAIAASLCKEAGTYLQQRGYKDFASYLLDVCKDALTHDNVDTYVLEGIARIPGFDDATIVDDEPLYMYKKALFLLHALQGLIMASAHDVPSIIQAMTQHWATHPKAPLPLFVDNVLPTMLTAVGILQLAHSNIVPLQTWHPEPVPGGDKDVAGPTLSQEDAYRIRAAALSAGDRIVRRAHQLAHEETALAWMATMTESDLDAYLWSYAKDPSLRSIPRLSERHTGMY